LIILSALASTFGEMVNQICFVAFRSITGSYLIGYSNSNLADRW